MKIKDGYILREIAGSFVVIPESGDMVLDGIITLNESGAFLFNLLKEEQTKDQLLNAMLKEYNIDNLTAEKDLNLFLERLNKTDIVEWNIALWYAAGNYRKT